MSYPWESAIRRLRRRAMISGALAMSGKVVAATVPLALLALLLGRWFVWVRIAMPYLEGAAAAALLAALVIGAFRAHRSELYFAKWIDLASQLEDRLPSAVEWSRLAEPDSFRARCIEQLSLGIGAGQWRLILPRTRPRYLALGLVGALAAAAAAVVGARQPAPPLERDAHRKFVAAPEVLGAAGNEVRSVQGAAASLGDPAFEQLATDLSSLVQSIAQGQADRETVLAEMDRLRGRAQAIERRASLAGSGGPASGGPAGALAQALSRGDPRAVRASLESALGALQTGGLSEEDLAGLEPMVRALSELARAAEPSLASQLETTAERLQAGDRAAAAESLARAMKQLPALDKPLTTVAMARHIEAVLATLDKTAEAAAAPGGGDSIRAQGGDDRRHAAPPAEGMPPETTGAAGTQSASERRLGAAPDGASPGNALRLTGVWSGKVVRQLFEGQHASGPSDEVRQVLVDHQHVVEDRFRSDEVPKEYLDAVRIYFGALHQKEGSWTQIKK